MVTVKLTEEAYNALVSRRVGRQSLSTTLLKNLTIEEESGWDVAKLNKDLEKVKRTSKRIPLEEAFR